MKVLIVDDHIEKATKLSRIVKESCPEAEITLTSNASDGFRMLQSSGSNLVLLDVILPQNFGDFPNESASAWFVSEVGRRLSGKSVPFIVGTTQYAQTLAKAHETFRNSLWSVVHVSEEDPRWAAQIRLAVQFAASNAERVLLGKTPSEPVDFAIVAALRSPEFSELATALGSGEQVTFDETGETWLKCRINADNGRVINVISSSVDEMGMTAMASQVTKLTMALRPKKIILVGIMAGNHDRVKISDLIVVESSWNTQAGKLTDQGFQPDVKSRNCSYQMANQLMKLVSEEFVLDFWKNWRGSERPPNIAAIYKGDVACSPFVVADGKTIDKLEFEQKRKILGLEMESFGFYDAAWRMGTLSPEVVCIKSVCDFGDGAKNDKYQTYCAALSAASAIRLIKAG